MFAAATFLALLILIVGDVSSLQPVEIYIILLLTFGYTLQLIPIYLWRLLTRGDPWRDPTRWPILRLSNVESWLRILLVAAVASFQLWFWFVRVPKLSNLGCEQYGFLLARVRLNLPVMQVVHILLYFGVLLTCIYMFARGFYVTFISPPNKEELPDMRSVVWHFVLARILTNLQSSSQKAHKHTSESEHCPWTYDCGTCCRCYGVDDTLEPHSRCEHTVIGRTDYSIRYRGRLVCSYILCLPIQRSGSLRDTRESTSH